MYDAILRAWESRLSEPAPLTGTVEAVTGHAPRTFRQWARDHRGDFVHNT
ncbi:hypothetical protein GCM10027445_27700 [Amycolatopsis endophytica]